ncbi:MAG: hypothetical protein VX681_13595 [Myxococcota bacterium]|nr:hypothetical protein [Myxococcota bacterium]
MKRRVVGVFLIAFALWPLIHRDLVWRYDVDPWKLFGFAMYSVPGPMKTVRVFPMSQAGRGQMLDFERYAPAEQRSVDRFRQRRRALGRLASMEPLGQRMLELHPDWEGATVAVVTLALDPETARLQTSVREQILWRSGSVEPERTP